MRRLPLLAVLIAVLAAMLLRTAVWADGSALPLCHLTSGFGGVVGASTMEEVAVGASVVDLRSGERWSGGIDDPFAMHSVIKPAIAAAVLQESYEQGRALSGIEGAALRQMVAQSANGVVWMLLGLIGEMEGLGGFYRRWGVPELVELLKDRWGSSRATPSHLASLYAAIASGEGVPLAARGQLFSLLDQVGEAQIWGARIPEEALPGWESLIKTGNYSLGATLTDGSVRDDRTTVDTPLGGDVFRGRVLLRMNSAAIWLSEPWRGGEARYVVAIMLEGYGSWHEAERLHEEVGELLAEALVRREGGEQGVASGACLRWLLS